jgi:Family of unknown function (DUF6074)
MTIPASDRSQRRNRANIIPFPLARQRPIIESLAKRMAGQLPAREKILHAELQRRIAALHRRGISDLVVEREVRALEATVRAMFLQSPDGAA